MVDIEIGQGACPPGWMEVLEEGIGILEALGILELPEPQYLWEMLMDLGQQVGHQSLGGTFAEGELSGTFELEGLDVGLDADGLAEAIRAELVDQSDVIESVIVDSLVGELTTPRFDFYYLRAEDSERYLYFAAEGDQPGSNDHDIRGFFAEPSLQTKLSTLVVEGIEDAHHEKLPVRAITGPVFFRDSEGGTHRLDVSDYGERIRIALEEAAP